MSAAQQCRWPAGPDSAALPLYLLGRINLTVDAIPGDDPGNGTGYVGLIGCGEAGSDGCQSSFGFALLGPGV